MAQALAFAIFGQSGHCAIIMANERRVALWLFCAAGCVALTLLTGGITRLMGAGLSITQWLPLRGIIPPLSDLAWQEEFALYQGIPQFSELNADMTLAGFQVIYWWEWGHRLLARLSGLVFLLPFCWFYWRATIARKHLRPLLVIFALGVFQAVLGWFMVQSGLDGVAVAPSRLSAHLLTALIIFSLCVYAGLQFYPTWSVEPMRVPSRLLVWVLLICLLLQAGFGALMAGLQAGHSYTDWPKMGGVWIPERLVVYSPGWRNFLQNPVMVQFVHRLLAYMLLALSLWHWARAQTTLSFWLFFGVLTQAFLGIGLLWFGVPFALAAIHQVFLLVLLVLCLMQLLDKPYVTA